MGCQIAKDLRDQDEDPETTRNHEAREEVSGETLGQDEDPETTPNYEACEEMSGVTHGQDEDPETTPNHEIREEVSGETFGQDEDSESTPNHEAHEEVSGETLGQAENLETTPNHEACEEVSGETLGQAEDAETTPSHEAREEVSSETLGQEEDPETTPNHEAHEEVSGETLNILSLPNEMLVKIISFLPETQDRVKLRYVSQKFQSISETPSLWRKLVWPDCSRRAKKCLHNVMKACGTHIKQLSFPRYLIRLGALLAVTPATLKLTEMAKILQYCKNLTHLSLPALDPFNLRSVVSDERLRTIIKLIKQWGSYSMYRDYRHMVSHCVDLDEQLRKSIQEMKHLEVLDIHCYGSFQLYLNLKVALKELTIHTVINFTEDIKTSENWVRNGFIPPNLNIVVLDGSLDDAVVRFRQFLTSSWPRWNSQIPAGHVACLKLYISHKAPLNLFQNMPVFQLQYGAIATLPFVKVNSMEADKLWLMLTDHDDGGKMIHKAKIFYQDYQYDIIHSCRQDNLDNLISNLTELDLSQVYHECKHIIEICPQLQRLNLENANLKLEDLKMIATCCFNLQGLNLSNSSLDNGFCMEVWEILSSMKLTHLCMSIFAFESSLRLDNIQEKQLVALFKLCTTLQALELHSSRGSDIIINYNKLLHHFPSLEYVRLISNSGRDNSVAAQDILSACNKLRCFHCYSYGQLSLLSVHNNNLQQLCISSMDTDLDDNFMETVSAHGGLIHVAFFVNTVTISGITTLIKNSPNLLTFALHEEGRYGYSLLSVSASLCKKFANRKLFTSGLFSTTVIGSGVDPEDFCDEWLRYTEEWLQNTDLMTLWLPDPFIIVERRW